jgi:hypothetical protein
MGCKGGGRIDLPNSFCRQVAGPFSALTSLFKKSINLDNLTCPKGYEGNGFVGDVYQAVFNASGGSMACWVERRTLNEAGNGR